MEARALCQDNHSHFIICDNGEAELLIAIGLTIFDDAGRLVRDRSEAKPSVPRSNSAMR